MKRLLKILNLGVLNLFYLFGGASLAFAQLNLAKYTCLERFIADFVTLVTGAIGIISLFAVVLGGVKYMTSGGDKYKVQDAQGAITGGIIGLVLALLAFLIVNLIYTVVAGEPFIFNPPC